MTPPLEPAVPDRRASLGRSLELVDGDLVLRDGLLVEVSGTDNLLQALTLRVLTPYGSDRFHTGYGLDVRQALTEPHGRRIARELLRLELVRTLAGDPRVREVRDVVFAETAAGQRLASVEVVLETVAGTATTLVVDPGVAEPT
jgi:phage baseplate assembly protein W